VCSIQLQRHLTQNHAALVKKLKEYFSTECNSLKHMKVHNTGTFQQEGIVIMQASYGIDFLITRENPHGVGETLVKRRFLYGAKIVLGKSSKDALNKMSLQSHSEVSNLCFDSRNKTSSSRKDQIITMFRHQL
jgi:hypothetical protein